MRQFTAGGADVQFDISGAFVANKTFTNIDTYLWTEIDNSVELYYHAGLALLEPKVMVVDARAGSQYAPVKTAGLPDANIALQVAPVLVLCWLL